MPTNLELVVFAGEIVLPAVLFVIVREKEDILCHALNLGISLHQVMVF